jgi:hypothetical protein
MPFGSRRRPCGPSTVLLVAIGILLHSATAHAELIRLAWDPSPTPGVIGYLVHVGTASGDYTEIHDVGQRTRFIFNGLSGQRYYFAVSSYLPGPIEGPLSEEVSGYATEPSPPERIRDYALAGMAALNADRASPLAGQLVCAQPPPRDCFDVISVIDSAREITSLAALPDGRVMFIEEGRRVRAVVQDRLLPEPALDIGPSGAIVHMAPDPEFSASGLVFIGIVEPSGGGRTELRIVRMRMVQDRLGEAATIITGLPLDAHPRAPFALDGEGHLYIALPAADSSTASTGRILRFNVDGTVPRDNPAASPVLAHGYARPATVYWDARAHQLWLSGTGGGVPPPIAYVELGVPTESREWPRFPRSAWAGAASDPTTMGIALQRSSPQAVMLVPENHGSGVQTASPGGPSEEFDYVRLDHLGTPLAVASGPDGGIHIALRDPALDTFSIVQLRPRR